MEVMGAVVFPRFLRRQQAAQENAPRQDWTLEDRALAVKQAQAKILAAVEAVKTAQREYEAARQAMIRDIEANELGISCVADDFTIEITERAPS